MTCLIHKLITGFGGMGDGYVCVKCGWDGYRKPFNSITLPERNDEMRFQEPPYIRRFNGPITWSTRIDDWTHYWDTKGVLQTRGNSI